MNIIGSGLWLESNWETQIAPQYSTDVLTNGQSLPFVQLWNQYTAGATLGPTAQAKLKEIVTRYGWTKSAEAQWESWLTTTQSATSGNYGAQKRAVLRSVIETWLGRPATEEELSATGPYWNMIGGTMGQYDTSAFMEGIRGTDEYKAIFAPKLPGQSEEAYLDWRAGINSVGNWYFNDRPGVAGEPYVNNFLGYTNEELLLMNKDGWSPGRLEAYYRAVEEAAFNKDVYGPILTEALGSNFTDDEWFALANGGKGSGQLRAKIVEAQNKVQFREAYRQVFGSDPGPGDYDRITKEFVSPAELIRETQATESADEMYEDVNELLMRVYGDGVTKGELRDMVLGRQNSGELRALINQATKLDQYTWVHKQYYGSEPTPEQYAQYAGYTGPAELQWEIVTQEKVDEMRPEITEAWAKVYPNEPLISDEELYTLYGEQEGYGDLRAKVKKTMQQFGEMEQAEDWMYSGAEQAEVPYRTAEQGGFKTQVPGLAAL
jgi:hypothetical protein